jgi:hypothetical protein
MSKIEEKIYNIDLVVAEIEAFPQTYDTILKDEVENGTLQVILRRKLNILCKEGTVCKCIIPGTRFGKVIYYVHAKSYYILVDDTRMGSEVYCFFNYQKLDKYNIKVEELWKLKGDEWVKIPAKVFHEGSILRLF